MSFGKTFAYGIQPETGLVHAFTLIDDYHGQAWASWCKGYLVLMWTRWVRAPANATPTCLGCALSQPR